jgi:hypothetical protein
MRADAGKVTNITQKNSAWESKDLHSGCSFLGIRGTPPSPWSIGIISLWANVKLNLGAQSDAGKILISKSLGVADVRLRLPLAPWKSSAFSLHAARADVTLGCGN